MPDYHPDRNNSKISAHWQYYRLFCHIQLTNLPNSTERIPKRYAYHTNFAKLAQNTLI